MGSPSPTPGCSKPASSPHRFRGAQEEEEGLLCLPPLFPRGYLLRSGPGFDIFGPCPGLNNLAISLIRGGAVGRPGRPPAPTGRGESMTRAAPVRLLAWLLLGLVVPACSVGGGSGTLTPTVAPGAPDGLAVRAGNHSVTIDWAASAQDARYSVLRSVVPAGPFFPVSEIGRASCR